MERRSLNGVTDLATGIIQNEAANTVAKTGERRATLGQGQVEQQLLRICQRIPS
jgi:hypothetical protein